jgi:8-oxo-dGTP pyrophosphatase MutT (NUDIX family)
MTFKRLSSKVVYTNPWYSIRKDSVIKPDGTKGDWHVIMRNPSVFIVPIDTQGQVTLIGVNRYTTQRYSLEIPAGGTDGQRPLVAAKRELKEEAGLCAKKWTRVGTFQVGNGLLDEIGSVYLAEKLTRAKHVSLDRGEGIIDVIQVPFKKALKMIACGKITDGQSIVALSLVSMKMKV